MEEVPFEDRDVPRVEIDWERSAWWWIRDVRYCSRWSTNALAVSLIALLLSMAGLQLGERLFSPAWQPNWTVDSLSAATATYTPRIVHWGVALLQSLLSFERMGWRELGFLTFGSFCG